MILLHFSCFILIHKEKKPTDFVVLCNFSQLSQEEQTVKTVKDGKRPLLDFLLEEMKVITGDNRNSSLLTTQPKISHFKGKSRSQYVVFHVRIVCLFNVHLSVCRFKLSRVVVYHEQIVFSVQCL